MSGILNNTMKEKLKKIDKAGLGVLFGAILPIIGFFVSYLVKTRGMESVDFSYYINMALHSPDNQQDILIFCMIPNMFMFYLSNFRWNLTNFTKGLVAVTLLLGLMLVVITVM